MYGVLIGMDTGFVPTSGHRGVPKSSGLTTYGALGTTVCRGDVAHVGCLPRCVRVRKVALIVQI